MNSGNNSLNKDNGTIINHSPHKSNKKGRSNPGSGTYFPSPPLPSFLLLLISSSFFLENLSLPPSSSLPFNIHLPLSSPLVHFVSLNCPSSSFAQSFFLSPFPLSVPSFFSILFYFSCCLPPLFLPSFLSSSSSVTPSLPIILLRCPFLLFSLPLAFLSSLPMFSISFSPFTPSPLPLPPSY